MPLDLLHFGSGTQAVHYFVLCYISIVGTVVAAAARSDNSNLTWIKGTGAYWFGGLLVAASTIWFLLVDEELFMPGLAGGELFAIFAAAFIAAVPTTRLVNLILNRMRLFSVPTLAKEEESAP